MKIQQYIFRTNLAFILALAGLILLPAFAQSQFATMEQQARKLYQPDSWRKSTKLPVVGLKFDDFQINGFVLKKTKPHSPTGGTDYCWSNKLENWDLHVIVNIFNNASEAHKKLYHWLVTGINVNLQKGAFSSSSKIIGDVSWVEPGSTTLAFIRDNVMIIMEGTSRKDRHLELTENIAISIDEVIKAEPRPTDATEEIEKLSPIIDSVVVGQTILRLNEQTRISITAHDPRGGKLEFTYQATGGNIFYTKNGVFFQATDPGEHTITVFARNPYNLRSKKSVTIIVEK